MKVTVIIPNYNGKEFLKGCLESLYKPENIAEVIIVDNGSDDGSADYIKKNYPEFTLLHNPDNKGFGGAVNQGINSSKTEFLFLLNNDTVLEENCVDNLLSCMETDPQLFAVSSRMVQYHDHSKMDDAGDEYAIMGWTRRVGYGKSPDRYNKRREVFSACAGAALYRKSVLDEIGYFDESFFAYMEDVDLSYRARINGYKCIYCPEAVVYHIGSGTSGGQYNPFKIKLAARNNIYVPYKNMPWPQLALNFVFLVLGFFMKYLFFLRQGEGRTYLDGLREGLESRHEIEKVKYQDKNLGNYLKIQWLLIKNTLKFLFY